MDSLENSLFFIFERYIIIKKRNKRQKNKHKITIYTQIPVEMLHIIYELCQKSRMLYVENVKK